MIEDVRRRTLSELFLMLLDCRRIAQDFHPARYADCSLTSGFLHVAARHEGNDFSCDGSEDDWSACFIV